MDNISVTYNYTPKEAELRKQVLEAISMARYKYQNEVEPLFKILVNIDSYKIPNIIIIPREIK